MEGSPITGLDRGQGRLARHDPSPSAGCRCHTPLSWVTGVPPVLSVGKRAGRPFPLGFAVPITPKPQPPRGFGASPGAATLGQHRRRNMTPSPSASCCQTKTRWPHRGVSPPPLLQLRSGLSLIELLVVIAIIVILAALSFQAVGAMRARGESAKCMSNLRSMGVAIQLYANDHDGRYPGPVWYSASWEIKKWGGMLPSPFILLLISACRPGRQWSSQKNTRWMPPSVPRTRDLAAPTPTMHAMPILQNRLSEGRQPRAFTLHHPCGP